MSTKPQQQQQQQHQQQQRHQGRILRLHFTCSAPLPLGTSLRVTSSVGPPPQNDVPDDNALLVDDSASVMSGASGEIDATAETLGGMTKSSASGGAGGDEQAKLHARLLQNTVEMYTSPETYPIWKTRRPVVAIDEGNDSMMEGAAADGEGDAEGGDINLLGPLIHRYRYVAVTPGATIDWSLCTGKEINDDGSTSTKGGNHTAATTPAGSDDYDEQMVPLKDHDDDDDGDDEPQGGEFYRSSSHEEEVEKEEDAGFDFPPVLYEHPPAPSKLLSSDDNNLPNNDDDDDDNAGDDTAKKSHGHKRVPSLYDVQGNPVVLPGSPTQAADHSMTSLLGASAASFASLTISGNTLKKTPLMTWANVSSLPYRTRSIGGAAADSMPTAKEGEAVDVEIVDHWNEGNDPAFQSYWETKQIEEESKKEAMKGATVEHEEDPDDVIPPLSEDDDPMDAAASAQAPKPESIFIVCYHLPIILSRDPTSGQWNACWSESLISKSEMYGVSTHHNTTWIGTVSNIPVELLKDPNERQAIRTVLQTMDCIPIFFSDPNQDNLLKDMYLGFCKQVLWPSFHNVDLLDLSMNGWGQRQQNPLRSDPVMACAVAAKEAKERRARSESVDGEGSGRGGVNFGMPGGEGDSRAEQKQQQALQSNLDQRRLDSWWNAYIQVNQKFSQVVADLVSDGDVVWVHDYHLALLPRMLRKARGETEVVGGTAKRSQSVTSQNEALSALGPRDPTAGAQQQKPVRMVFFIHVPFPTSQVFRELEHGEALLEGMLHADVVGFHAFDHARHFLNAAKRILGLTYESLVGGLIGVRHRGTKVLVTVSNVSVEADIIDALLEFPSVKEEAAALQRKHSGRSIISGIAVAQRLSGVSYKLLAFERLLTDYPVWQSKVVLLQRCLIPGARRVDEADTLREVRSLVKRIQKTFGNEVIDYEEQVGSVLPIDQRLAIWTSSQVMMNTPIREGLNLCPLEYVFSRKEPADPGVIISSEFSAVSSVLNGALRVNPYDIQMCVTSIDCALSMSFDERDARRGRDIDFVSSCPSGLWTRNVLRDLNDATLGSLGCTKMDAVGASSPDSKVALEAELGLERLDLPALEHAYAVTKTRVIIIDFNGTLVVKEPAGKYLKREILGTSGFKPSHMTTLALRRLCSDPKNTVYVVSGDSQPNLELAVGNVPGLGLAASNGTCFSDPGGQKRVWHYLDFGVDWTAVKKVAMPIISKFTARTNGSFVKLSHSSIGWSYYSCDPEWGSLQASHLVTELGQALHSFDVRFVALKGIVEVVPRKGHKGHIVKKILQDARARSREVDFVLCMGDDIADEKMFTSVINFAAGSEGDNSYAFNVAVGKKPTNASFYVDSASDVGDILVALSGDMRFLDGSTSDTSAASEDFFA
ncbi:hypothetical protein ACHAXR_012780 [Thalassiosira sp. AJA248-18]